MYVCIIFRKGVYDFLTNQNKKYITKRKKILLTGWKVSPEADNQIGQLLYYLTAVQLRQNKWCLIVDLSSPDGCSINDGIDLHTCSLSYVSVGDIAASILHYGRRALIAKTDIKQVYRQLPVHPQDCNLLSMRWQGSLFVDCSLPFGLHSAPLILSAVADALEWIARSRGATNIFHYIDDFIMVGSPQSEVCELSLRIFAHTCDTLGMPIAHEKTKGPATRLTVLGIELDTLAMEMRLPSEKLERLSTLLKHWRGRKADFRKDLKSLAGMLQHACNVVHPSCTFLRRVYELLARMHSYKSHYSVRLNTECQADLEWWVSFLGAWNGTSILRPLRAASPEVELWSDALGSWGCGAYWCGLWFQDPWGHLPIATQGIAAKELFPIVVASVLWGHAWTGCTVCCYCDNKAVVDLINNQSARDALLCHLMCCLFFASARYDFDMYTLAPSTLALILLHTNPLFRLLFITPSVTYPSIPGCIM